MVEGEAWLLKWKTMQKEEAGEHLLRKVDQLLQEQFEGLGDHHPNLSIHADVDFLESRQPVLQLKHQLP